MKGVNYETANLNVIWVLYSTLLSPGASRVTKKLLEFKTRTRQPISSIWRKKARGGGVVIILNDADTLFKTSINKLRVKKLLIKKRSTMVKNVVLIKIYF